MSLVPRFLVCALLLVPAGCGKPAAQPAPAAPVVQVLTLVAEEVPADGTFVGRTVPNRTIEARARVTGILLERSYNEGERVAEGTVLFRIDPREFEAARDSAAARVAQAEAQVVRTTAELGRTGPLAKAGAASQSDLDAANAAFLAARADRDAAKAALVRAELELSFTVITAPFAGIAGKSAVDPGGLVSPGIGALAVLDQVDPIAVEFTVSEAELIAWRSDIAAGRMRSPGVDHLLVAAALVDGSSLPDAGRIAFRDVRIKPETGTALIRAIFPNPEGRLRAGQFIRLTVTGAVRVGVVLVPQSAVLESPAGPTVYVVAADGTAQVRPITLGTWHGTRWQIRSGLQPGDRVIIDGIQRVRAGAPVIVGPASATSAAAP